MTQKEIKHVQEIIGVETDGFWGPISTEAAKRHLKDLMPSNRFPTQREVRKNTSIFGKHGERDGDSPPMKKIKLPFALHLYGKETDEIKQVSCHVKCANELLAVFERLADVYTTTKERKEAGILDYYGVYNPRFIRNGRVWSMHAYAIAIDLDANRNKNRSHWPTISKMPIEVMECFAKEGFLAAGAFWNRDAMHFQATSM